MKSVQSIQIKSLFFTFPSHSVALNFQTAGEGMDLNDGLFSQNGGCGYVLKPCFMRDTEKRFDPDVPQQREDYHPVVLTIQVELTNSVSIANVSKTVSILC